MKNFEIEELLKEEIPYMEKVGNKKLKQLFNKLSGDKEEVESIKFLQFYDVFLSHFKIPKEFDVQYWDEKRALTMYYNPEVQRKKAMDVIVEQISRSNNYNFHQFRKAFLIISLHVTSKMPYTLSSGLEITKMTMKQDTPYKRKQIQTVGKNNSFDSVSFNAMKKNDSKLIDDRTNLPEQRGLRVIIFSEIMKNLSASETLKCALVSREWLSISRSDVVWKSHYKRDIIPLQQEQQQEYNPFEMLSYPQPPKLKQPIPNQNTDNKPQVEKPLDFKQPAFVEYFNYLDTQLEFSSNKFKIRPRIIRCGIGATPRGDLQPTEEQQQPESFPVDQEELTGCCHDSVDVIAQQLFSKKSFVSLSEGKFESESSLEKWKRGLVRQVGVECMDEKMEESEIKNRISSLIVSRLFQTI